MENYLVHDLNDWGMPCKTCGCASKLHDPEIFDVCKCEDEDATNSE